MDAVAPEWLGQALTIVMLASLLFTTFYVRQRKRDQRAEPAIPAIDGDVLVRGWSGDQLRTILADFAKTYELGRDPFDVAQIEDGWSRVAPKEPLAGDRLLYLVNHLHYPRDLDASSAAPLAVARFTTVTGFAPSNTARATPAKAYVPLGDDAFDEVYVQVENGAAYRVPFTDLHWNKVTKPRMDLRVERLRFAAT